MADSARAAAPAQTSTSWSDIPAAIRSRLVAENIHNAADWRALGQRRFQVFGITRRMARVLDELAGEHQ